MHRPRVTMLLAGFVALVGWSAAIQAQVPTGTPPAGTPTREQIHPELVDTSYGPRTAAAWKLALDHHWEDAQARFSELHARYPFGLEAILGLGFVARANGRRDDALSLFRQAMDEEPSENVRTQLEAVEWDRPSSVSLSADATHVGERTTTDWSAAAIVPVNQQLFLSARLGVLGAGDPLRGVFLDSASGATQSRVISGGVVVRPTDQLALSARADYWKSTTESQTFAWFDATQRLGDHFAVRLGTRPVGGETGGAQYSGGVDIAFIPSQTLSLDVVQGAKAAPFEARTQIRAFYFGAPTLRQTIRAGLLRDTGPTNQATTGFVAGSWLFTPMFGVQVDASKREGAFARTSAGGGLVIRW